jgi:hypothetical protein
MSQVVWIGIAIAAGMSLSGPAEAAVTMAKSTCPVKADAAFKVVGAKGEEDGVTSEYTWLAAKRPGWKMGQQSEHSDSGKFYDVLTISKGADRQVICFDITDFFGK